MAGKKQSSQEILKQFYEEAIRITGFSKEKIKELLVAEYGASGSVTKATEYLEFLRKQAEDVRLKKVVDEERRKERMKQFPHVERNPCPVPGCGGLIYEDTYWRWVCSIGGVRHYLIANSARISGIPIEVMLEKVNAVSEEKLKQKEQEMEEWRKGINEPIPENIPYYDTEDLQEESA